MKPGFRYPTRPVHRNAQAENGGYTEDEYCLTLQGTAYLEDNRKVAHYLQEAIRGHTTAYNHCSDKLQAQLGRQAFMALVGQYEGAGNVINQVSAAEKALNLLHYQGHEARFSFNDYFAQAKKYFRTLALDPNFAMTAGAQVKWLHDHMSVRHNVNLTLVLQNSLERYPDDVDPFGAYFGAACQSIHFHRP